MLSPITKNKNKRGEWGYVWFLFLKIVFYFQKKENKKNMIGSLWFFILKNIENIIMLFVFPKIVFNNNFKKQ